MFPGSRGSSTISTSVGPDGSRLRVDVVTRLGFAIGGGFALTGAAFLSVTSFGVERPTRSTPDRLGAASAPTSMVPLAAGADRTMALPVQGYARSNLFDSWGDARSGGRGHRGIDLMAAEGTPVVAAVTGTIEKLFESRLGGTTLYLRSADGKWIYYYAHLAGYASGLREGLRVRTGQVLGYVGDTGDAGPGNYHLHFSVSRMKPGERWWQGQDVNPYPLLAERGGRR